MKKNLLFFLLLSFLMPVALAHPHSDFQKKLSCKMMDKSVRVYLLQEEGTSKCSEYLSVVNNYLKSEYQMLVQIMSNLNRWDDVAYRKGLYTEKKDQFLKLFSQKKMIETAMQDFENELLHKSKLYLHTSLLEKQMELEDAMLALQKKLELEPQNPLLQKSLADLKEKLALLDTLFVAEDMDSFMVAFTRYLDLFSFSAVWK